MSSDGINDIAVQSISASATVEDTNFRVKSIEVDRATGKTIGKATIKGITDDVDSLQLGDQVTVIATAESTDEPFAEDLDTFGTLFTGEAHVAKQNEEGVVTIEAYDSFDKLQTRTVKLETENNVWPDEVLVDFLEELYSGVTRNIENAGPDTPYVAPRDDFPANFSSSIWRFGNAEQGEPLISAISELVDTMGGYMWVDRNGIVRFEGYPNYTEWETPLVTEINAGDETKNADEVIFEATATDSDLGQGATFVSTQVSHTSSTGIAGGPNEPEAPTEVLEDRNISTEQEADERAYNEAVNQDQRRNFGEVTIIGNADIDLYDHIRVPEIDYNGSGFGDIRQTTAYEERRFKVDGIVHKINSSDGFLTTVKLSPAIDDSYNRASSNALDLQQNYLADQSNAVESEELSGNEGSTGFLGDLFGGFL